jgi:hypothetical protein
MLFLPVGRIEGELDGEVVDRRIRDQRQRGRESVGEVPVPVSGLVEGAVDVTLNLGP